MDKFRFVGGVSNYCRTNTLSRGEGAAERSEFKIYMLAGGKLTFSKGTTKWWERNGEY